jgi:hypothetical protein
MFEFHSCHEVLWHPEYEFDIDEYRRGDEQFLLAHIYFRKFSPSILKRVLREWHIFRQCVTSPLYVHSGSAGGDQDKWERFVSLLGFRPTGINIICNNGATRQLFIHTVSNDILQANHTAAVPDDTVGTAGCRALRCDGPGPKHLRGGSGRRWHACVAD